MANYPTSVPSFTTKTNGQTIDASHINSPQDEIVAIGTDLLKADTAVAYNGANFTASGGATWTVDLGDQLTFVINKLGKEAHVGLFLAGTTIAVATPVQLFIAIPGGFVAAVTESNTITVADGGGTVTGILYSVAASPFLIVEKQSGAVFAIGANNVTVRGQLRFSCTV